MDVQADEERRCQTHGTCTGTRLHDTRKHSKCQTILNQIQAFTMLVVVQSYSCLRLSFMNMPL